MDLFEGAPLQTARSGCAPKRLVIPWFHFEPTYDTPMECPSLRHDLLSFGPAFGEPVTAPHVAHTWPLGWTVGSIGGDALRASPAVRIMAENLR